MESQHTPRKVRGPTARDVDMIYTDMDIDLEVNLDWESRDRDYFVEYDLKKEEKQDVDLTMEVEMNPVFLLIHHIEVIS